MEPNEGNVELPDGSRHEFNALKRNSALLQRFHGQSVRPQCHCRGTDAEPLPFIIRHIKDQYTLAAFPNTVHLHDADTCAAFSPKRVAAPFAVGAFDSNAIRKIEGGYRVFLNTSLSNREERAPELQPDPNPDGSRAQGRPHNRIELLGLLEFLWECACLHEAHGNGDYATLREYRYGLLRDRAYDAAKQIYLAKGSLRERLWIPSDKLQPKICEVIEALRFLDEGSYWFYVGRIRGDWRSECRGKYWRLPVVGDNGVQLVVPAEIKESAERSYGALTAQKNAHRWLIAKCARPNENGGRGRPVFCIAHEVAWMTTHPYGIPVDSGLELKVVERLFAAGRTFKKPLRYAKAGLENDPKWESVHPDFVLGTAGGAEIPMEVWGRDDPEYIQKISARLERYAHNKITYVWQWHAYRNDPLPPFDK
jgi:hypothetical protein